MSDPSEIHPFPVDPGGVFASDLHRRVLAFLPHDDGDEATLDAIDVPLLISRLHEDPDSLRKSGKAPNVELVAWTPGDLLPILEQLAADSYAYQTEATDEAPQRWTASEAGIAALNGPALTHAEKQADGSTLMVEPPPMEGARLEQAEAVNEAAAAEVEDYERRAAAERLERAKAELAEAEARVEEVGA
jgi:hypothetical protein